MGIDDWATKRGERPSSVGTVTGWFLEHEQVRAELREARAQGWSWRQLTHYIQEEYGFPFRDTESVAKECL